MSSDNVKGFIDYQPAELTNLIGRVFNEGYLFQRRRHDQWQANYDLYRLKSQINRFTQRQSVCLPIMKSTINTVLSSINQPPTIRFFSKDNDEKSKQTEIYMNGAWEHLYKWWNGITLDRVDKKSAALYGRGIKIFGIVRGVPTIRHLDPYDLLVDPGCDPANVDATADYMVNVNIKQTKYEIQNNPWFDQTQVDKILDSIDGYTGGQTDYQIENAAKNRRIQDMGYGLSSDTAFTEVTRRDYYLRLYCKRKEKEIIYYIPCINDQPVACLPLSEVIGKTSDDYWDDHFPINSWTDDVDGIDFWSDGVGDTVRDANRLINIWWSQEVENRTLKNLSMFFYNSTITPEFIPQTFNPYAWAFFPVPGNPADLMQQIPIPDLSSSLDQIAWVKNMIEQATAATTTMQGATTPSTVTLGEVELAVGAAQQRIQSMTPFYSHAWQESAQKLYKLIEGGANSGYLDKISMVKRGARGNSFMQSVKYKDLITPHGYTIEALPENIDEQQTMDDLQKLNVAISVMPENAALKRIYKEKLIDVTNLTPEQKNEVKQAEEQAINEMEQQLLAQEQMTGGGMQMGMQPATNPNLPVVEDVTQAAVGEEVVNVA